MHIARSGRFVFVAQWVAAVVLPVFVFLGRGLVGAQMGWMAVLGLFYGFFAILIMLIPPVLTLFDRTVRRQKTTRFAYDISSFVLWGALVVAGLSIPDAGDGGPVDTALTVWTGGAITTEGSTFIFGIAGIVIGLAYLAVFVFAVMGIVRWRRPVGA